VIEQLLRFCGDNLNDLREEQARIESKIPIAIPAHEVSRHVFHPNWFRAGHQARRGVVRPVIRVTALPQVTGSSLNRKRYLTAAPQEARGGQALHDRG